MSRDLYYAAGKKKRTYGESLAMGSTLSSGGLSLNQPQKKLYNIVGLQEPSTCPDSKNGSKNHKNLVLSEEAKNILAYKIQKERNTEEKPKGSMVGINPQIPPGQISGQLFNGDNRSKERPDNKDNKKNDDLKGQNNKDNKKIEIINPFLSSNITEPVSSSSLNKPKGSLGSNESKLLITNPFLNTAPDLGAPTNYETNKISAYNPFLSSTGGNLSNLSFNFNFNLNNPVVNKAFEDEDDDEEDEDGNNPEVEQPITADPKNESHLPKVIIQSETTKFYEKKVEEFFLYNFKENKYFSKGQGTVSMETYVNQQSKKLTAIIVFRGVGGFKILFQGNILNDVSSVDRSKKPMTRLLYVSKIFTMDEGKLTNNALKIKFTTVDDENEFYGKFEELSQKLRDDAKQKEEPEKKEKANENERKVTTIKIKCMKKI